MSIDSDTARDTNVPDSPTSAPQPPSPTRWRSVFFAPQGDGVRVRLGSDVWRIVVIVVLFVFVVIGYRNGAGLQGWFVRLTTPAPIGVAWVLTILALVGTLGVIALLLLTSLISRRRDVLIDVVGAAVISLVLILVFRHFVGVTAGTNLAATYPKINVGFPVPGVTVAVAVALVARPYLARSFQLVCSSAIGLGAIATVFGARGLPLSVFASFLLGWGASAIMRLITGTPSGLPGVDDVLAMVRELGIQASQLKPVAAQTWGSARFDGTDASGVTLRVSVFGRDARDAEFAASIGHAIAYRSDGQSVFASRLQQAEHLAYLTLRANTALDGRSANLVGAGAAGPSRDGIVVTATPPGTPLREVLHADSPMDDVAVRSLLQSVVVLGEQGLSHGSIDQDHVVITSDGSVAIDDFARGTSAASPIRSNRDLASAVVCCALSVGVEAALDASLAVAGTERMTSCLPYLEKAALPSALADAVKSNKQLLTQLRDEGAKRLGIDSPEPVQLTRVSASTLVIAAGTVIGGWALIAVFVNVAASFSTIKGANLLWVALVAILALIPYPAGSLSDEGSIPGVLPFFKLTILEISNAFSGLAVGTPGVLAARVRFYQKQGNDSTTAVSSGVVTSAASWIVKGALFLIALPFALSNFHFKDNPAGGDHTKLIWLILAAICLVAFALGLVLFVPRLRRMAKAKLTPKAKEIRQHLGQLATRPSKLFALFGGSLIAQLAVAYALGASLHAFGTNLSIAEILIVLTLGSMLGGMSPVPGGMGVVEAGMIIGLTAVGVPQNVAVSAVFVQRLFTAYLPPLFGWFALIWLRRQDLL
jgi:glycosyltransferase 2 family protein